MNVSFESADLPAGATPMRTLIARPASPGTYPGLLFYSDIFGLTASMQRSIARFASYGFVVAAPEIYHRFEAAGCALDFVADYQRAQDDSKRLRVREIDEDARAVIDYLKAHPAVGGKSVHATGFCIGGHLAFRAALQPEIRSGVFFYPTGLHTASLGGDENVDTLARCGELRGNSLLIFGASDPHIPLEGRRAIEDALRAAKVRHHLSEYDGEHAFMRDEGPRYNPSECDRAMFQATAFLYQNT